MRLLLAVSVLTLLPLCSGLFGLFGNKQTVAVSGRLQCNGEPAKNVKVKLYDKGLFFDTKLAEGHTDSSGYFHIGGYKKEVSSIDPKVNIYHKCGHKGLCYQKVSFDVPSKFIVRGRKPKKTFDLGTLNLATKFKGQSTDCIN
ncbi:unnamed protein product [Heligmosomoides polygyrus]|uniref:Transthyretin-like family protein n=1 Tax=Heligmosomoides polygyrus TaxID=6339 RepID=A0A3P7ZJD2_HELPZ|nr:unnamed protein product [Heligmosomoides polygyrus]